MNGGATLLTPPAAMATDNVAAQAGTRSCPTCGGESRPYAQPVNSGFVYGIGSIAPQFADLGVEKEFVQMGVTGGTGGVETARLLQVLKDPQAFWLARQMCWVFSAGGAEAFVIVPRDDAEVRTLIDSLSTGEDQTLQVIVGAMTAPPAHAACARAALPAIAVDQHLTFTLKEFIAATASAASEGKGAKVDAAYQDVARDIFARLTVRTDNKGRLDEHRALNYLALRYPAVYHLAAEQYRAEKQLVDVQVRPGTSGNRRIVTVRLIFRARRTELVDRFHCSVDVTDRFPFLTGGLSAVYD